MINFYNFQIFLNKNDQRKRDPLLKGFFDMLYQSMNPSSKNSSTEISLKTKVMILCYQLSVQI